MTNTELNHRTTKIMGWTIYISEDGEEYYKIGNDGPLVLKDIGTFLRVRDWTPSISIAQAMMVVDRMEDLGFGWEMGEKYVQFWLKLGVTGLPKGSYLRYDKREDRYRTICLAAVEAWENCHYQCRAQTQYAHEPVLVIDFT